MINSAEEFVQLRTSSQQEDYLKAANDEASAAVWVDIIQNYPDMRIWVARNKTVPMEVLEMLALDSEPSIRIAVAMKNKLSLRLVEQLAKDSDSLVRQRIAYNKNTHRHILEQLANDDSELVASVAREKLKI